MEVILMLIIGAAGAWISNMMAKTRKREPLWWTIFGFLFPLPTIIVLAIMGESKK